jgi:hypothetical protein
MTNSMLCHDSLAEYVVDQNLGMAGMDITAWGPQMLAAFLH